MAKHEPKHILDQTWPAFLDRLDSAPDVAFENFYAFATRLLTLSPPGPLRSVFPQDRMDLIHEVILSCRENDYQVLRRYKDRGRPFAAWFMSVARNRIIDLLRSQRVLSTSAAQVGVPLLSEESRTDPSPLPDERVWALQLLNAVTRCKAKLGLNCRLLLEGSADGMAPRQLTHLLGWPADWNKKASDDLRACRKRLLDLLHEEGFDVTDLTGVVSRTQKSMR